MFSIRRVYAVAKREYLELRRDTLYMVMAFLCPVILFLPFAYGLNLDVDMLGLGVCDMANTYESRELVQTFLNCKSTNNDYFILKKYSLSYDTMDDELKSGRVKVVMIIPQDFSKKLRNHVNSPVQFNLDAAFPNRADTTGGYIESAVADFNDKLSKQYAYYSGDQKYGKSTIQICSKVWFNDTLESIVYIIPPLIPIILYFFPPLLSAITIVKEKEIGSIMAFLCSPVSKAEYIIGKIIPYSAITYVNFIVLFILVRLLFPSIPFRGSLAALLFLGIFYCIATAGIGILISVLMSSQVAAVMICFVGTMIPAFNYSGFNTSTSSMGTDAYYVSQTMSVTYFVSLVRQIFLKAAGVEYLVNDGLMIIFFSIALPAAAILLFKKKL